MQQANWHIDTLPEIYLQKLIRRVLSETGRRRATVRSQSLQVLSVGEWNLDAGPDFLHMAVLMNGRTLTGHGEVHRRNSDWKAHRHQHDPRYRDVLLHIILDYNIPEEFAAHTLVIERAELQHALEQERAEIRELRGHSSEGPQIADVLQDYAARRLHRKSAAATEMVEKLGLEGAVYELSARYFDKRRAGKGRPGGIAAQGDAVARGLGQSRLVYILTQMAQEQAPGLETELSRLPAAAIAGEGQATRMEVLVNVFLPLALGMADAAQRSALLNWFWSLPARHQYRALQRKFEHLPQDTVWQQQGILEYYLECRFGKDRVADILIPYGPENNAGPEKVEKNED